MKRNETLPRHSKILSANLRIPRPLCTCGRPNVSGNSHSANRHSALSFFGRFCKRRNTAGSIDRSLLKQVPQLRGRDGHQFPRPLEPAIAFVGGRRKRRNLLWRRRVFALRVVGGFHVDPAQSNDFGPTDNPDVLSAGGSLKPAAQILSRIRYSKSLHGVFIQSLKRFVNPLEERRARTPALRLFHRDVVLTSRP